MNENGSIGSDKLSKIIDSFPFFDAVWLLTGKGDMIRDDVDKDSLKPGVEFKYKSRGNIPSDNTLLSTSEQSAAVTIYKGIVAEESCNSRELASFVRDLLYPISELYLFPRDIDMQGAPEAQQALRKSFYSSMVKLLIDFEIHLKPNDLSYIAKNLGCQPSSIEKLINELGVKQNNVENNMYHTLGFRSIHYILHYNVAYIKPNYIYNINRMLLPFFERYRFKNRLTSWLGISTGEF